MHTAPSGGDAVVLTPLGCCASSDGCRLVTNLDLVPWWQMPAPGSEDMALDASEGFTSLKPTT